MDQRAQTSVQDARYGEAARRFAPAIERLARGTVASVELIADGNGVAARWTAAPATLVQRLLARRVGPFAAPARA